MDDRRLDQLAIRLGGSRRRFLNQVAGLGGAAAVARLATDDAEAARRGYSGPPIPAPGAITLQGAHTHFLPEFLKDGEEALAGLALPDYALPVAIYYPAEAG